MAGPVSIPLEQLTAAAKSSVANALKRHEATFAKPDYVIGFVPPYWWLGIVIRNPDNKVTLADAQALATDVQSGVADSVKTLSAPAGGIIFVGGHVTIGFAPPPDVSVTEE
jgi:hypothetical protein